LRDETATDELLTRYALGRLSGPDLDQVEERIFVDRDFFERLLVVEDELIDAYAAGKLSGDDRQRFQQYLLQNKADRERVTFARQLAEVATREAAAARGTARRSRLSAWTDSFRGRVNLVLAAATVLLALAGSWLVVQTSRLGDRLQRLEAERAAARERAGELEQQIAAEREQNRMLSEELDRERALRGEGQPPEETQPSSRSFVSMILSLGAIRGGGQTPTLTIPRDVADVRIQARFKTGSYPTYRAELQTVEGRPLWSRAGLKARTVADGRAVSVSVPATMFREDDYILMLKGVTSGEEESVAEYFFRVVKK
jgi:hypothetical protein